MTCEAEPLPGPHSQDGCERAFRRLAGGSLAALEELYDGEGDGLFALALWVTGSRDEAADAVQDVFVKLAAHRNRLGQVRRPRAYLLAMARSAAIDRIRSDRGSDRSGEPSEDLLLEAPASDPAARAEARRATRHLRRLPLEQREAVYLRHFAELSFAEIGRLTGVSLFTAASRYRLGLARLRRWMGVVP